MTLIADGADFSPDGELFFEEFSGWTITLSGVSNFSVTGTWDRQTWSAVLADIVGDAGYCMTTNTTTHTITISNC